MIKANEVRIGNLFRDKLTGSTLQLDEIVNQDGKHVLGFYVVDREKYPLPSGWQAERIPLTPEILEKAGFEMRSEKEAFDYFHPYWLPNNYAVSHCINKTGYHHQQGAYYCGKTDVELKYLHQLQNLYFALTGSELTIDL